MTDCQLSSLQIVVLAAGLSVRLGAPKMLERIHGRSLIRRMITVLAQVTPQRIVVVTAPHAARLRAELRGFRVGYLANPDRAKGLSTSVVVALRKTRYSRATLFLPADLAELGARDLARLIRRWRGAGRRVVARGIAGRPTAPLILPRFLYRLAQRLSGDVGLRALVAELPPEQYTLVDLPSAARDIDTLQDLKDARHRAPRPLALPRRGRGFAPGPRS
jgi:molybdenum cofactor cytidylyltransferase